MPSRRREGREMKWRATCGGGPEKRRAGHSGAWRPGPKLDTDATRPEEFMRSCLVWVVSGRTRQLTWLCQVGRRLKRGEGANAVAGDEAPSVLRQSSPESDVRTEAHNNQRAARYVRYEMGRWGEGLGDGEDWDWDDSSVSAVESVAGAGRRMGASTRGRPRREAPETRRDSDSQ